MIVEHNALCILHIWNDFFMDQFYIESIEDGKIKRSRIPIMPEVSIISSSIHDILYKIYTSYQFVVDCGLYADKQFQNIINKYSIRKSKLSPIERFECVPKHILFSCVVEYILYNNMNEPDFIYKNNATMMLPLISKLSGNDKLSMYSIWTFYDFAHSYKNIEIIIDSHLTKIMNELDIDIHETTFSEKCDIFNKIMIINMRYIENVDELKKFDIKSGDPLTIEIIKVSSEVIS